MPEKLTTEYLRAVKKSLPRTTRDVYDSKQAGLVLRLRPSGKHTYRLLLGRGRWHTLGPVDDLTPDEARTLAQAVRGDVSKAKALGHADPVAARRRLKASPTFKAFVTDHYEKWAVVERRTGAEQAARLRAAFGSSLDAKRLDQITAFDVNAWKTARRKDGVSVATLNRDVNTLKAALRLAVSWGLLAAFPLAEVKPGKVDTKGRVRFLSDAEDKSLQAALDARDRTRQEARERSNEWRRARGYKQYAAHGTFSDHVTPLVRLALNTGLRRGELFNLRWRDVDLGRALLTIDGAGSKSGLSRHVPLNATAVKVLTTWGSGEVDPDDYVFPSGDGERLEDVKGAWLRLMKSSAIRGFTFHDLRHTFASRLVQAGVDLNTVRELLGHGDIKMTLRYAHLAPEHKAAAVAKLVTP